MSTNKPGHQPDDDAAVARMIAAAGMAGLLTLAKDDSLTVDEWWEACEPHWRSDPVYLANLEAKADEHGREWVRENMAAIHGHWKNSLQLAHVQAFVDEHGSLDEF